MKLYSLASSSKANCYVYEFGDTKILVDVGLSRSKIVQKLKNENLSFANIDALLITHEHSDHIRGLEIINKYEDIKVFLSQGTNDFLKYDLKDKEIIKANEKITIGEVEIEPIKMSHDANEPLGYIFYYDGKKYTHVLDTGYLIPETKDKILESNFYLIESNYDEEALITNKNYPFPTKQRILSDKGHLSNVQCNNYLKELCVDCTELVCYGHLSPQNNDADLVYIMNGDLKDVEQIVLDRVETVVVQCK